MVRISRREFKRLVVKALDDLPSSIRERMDNVDVVVHDWASGDELEGVSLDHPGELFGLYQGIPLTERSHYDMALPDRIAIFRKPIRAVCATRLDVVREVRATVIHEIAHHFGISDAALDGPVQLHPGSDTLGRVSPMVRAKLPFLALWQVTSFRLACAVHLGIFPFVARLA